MTEKGLATALQFATRPYCPTCLGIGSPRPNGRKEDGRSKLACVHIVPVTNNAKRRTIMS